MDVYVYLIWRQRDLHHGQGMPLSGQEGVIGLLDSVGQPAIVHPPAIDK